MDSDFDRAVRGLIQRMIAEANYRPTRFMQMVTELGAVEAVRTLLAADAGPGVLHEGLTRLWNWTVSTSPWNVSSPTSRSL